MFTDYNEVILTNNRKVGTLGRLATGTFSLGLLLAAVVVGQTTTEAPASAAFECPDLQICLYRDADLQGAYYMIRSPKPGDMVSDFQSLRFNDGTSVNDQVSSIDNRSNYFLAVHTDSNRNGLQWLAAPGTRITNLAAVHTTIHPAGSMNDSVSSFAVR